MAQQYDTPYVPKEGFANIFKSTLATEENRMPPYRGTGMWKGEIIELSFWIKESKTGGKFFSGTIQKQWTAGDDKKEAPAKKAYGAAEPDDSLIGF